MKECADIFYQVRGVRAEVITGPGSDWILRAKEDADVIYEETEYRLSQFMTRHP
jgi:accessory colonization factor AcfC